jgi:hypothetical protein
MAMERIVRETINFERGLDPMKSMGIGIKIKIEEWLKENLLYASKKPEYHINDDFTIDFLTDCDLRFRDSPPMIIPKYIKFNIIYGYFTFSGRNVKSLKGWSPEIVHGNYHCNDNLLISLDGCPKIVEGTFTCYSNKKLFTEKYVRSKCKVGGYVQTKKD